MNNHTQIWRSFYSYLTSSKVGFTSHDSIFGYLTEMDRFANLPVDWNTMQKAMDASGIKNRFLDEILRYNNSINGTNDVTIEYIHIKAELLEFAQYLFYDESEFITKMESFPILANQSLHQSP